MLNLWSRLNAFVARAAVAAKREEGQTMVEYGLIVALIALVVVATIFLVGGQLNTVFNNVLTQLKQV